MSHTYWFHLYITIFLKNLYTHMSLVQHNIFFLYILSHLLFSSFFFLLKFWILFFRQLQLLLQSRFQTPRHCPFFYSRRRKRHVCVGAGCGKEGKKTTPWKKLLGSTWAFYPLWFQDQVQEIKPHFLWILFFVFLLSFVFFFFSFSC